MLKSFLDEEQLVQDAVVLGVSDKLARLHIGTVIRKVIQHEKQNKVPGQEFDLSKLAQALPPWVHEVCEGRQTVTSKVVQVSESSDYVTTKLLIELQESELQIETVILRHQKRTTICVSSQVGCKMKCTFCATGTLGQIANLKSWEISEQLIHALRFLNQKTEPRTITNVVFMGMGEPLNNYTEVVQAVRTMVDPGRFSLSPSRVTISTVGVVNRMRQLFQEMPNVRIALSLHAPNQELRQLIIPTATSYPIDKLMATLMEYVTEQRAVKSDTCVMIEYILLHGVNDMPEIAHELAELLKPMGSHVKVNLIPYNPIFNAQGLAKTFAPPAESDVVEFQRILHQVHGLFCTARKEMGQDMNAACGQLACVAKDDKKLVAAGVLDIEDLYQSRKDNNLYSEETGKNVWKKTKAADAPRPALDRALLAAAAAAGTVLAVGLAVAFLLLRKR